MKNSSCKFADFPLECDNDLLFRYCCVLALRDARGMEGMMSKSVSTSAVKDMTVGSPVRLILGFAIPMLLGLLFQQFYSMVDAVIVGRCLGVDALAAVGSTGAVNFILSTARGGWKREGKRLTKHQSPSCPS